MISSVPLLVVVTGILPTFPTDSHHPTNVDVETHLCDQPIGEARDAVARTALAPVGITASAVASAKTAVYAAIITVATSNSFLFALAGHLRVTPPTLAPNLDVATFCFVVVVVVCCCVVYIN